MRARYYSTNIEWFISQDIPIGIAVNAVNAVLYFQEGDILSGLFAKAGFKGDVNYDPKKGFSISQNFMKDYDFLCVRTKEYISVIVKEEDYSKFDSKSVISKLKDYINYDCGEIYIMSKKEVPLIYAATRKLDNIESFSLVRKI